MKNKKLVYILLPAVIGIWGFSFNKLYQYFFSSEKVADYSIPYEQESLNVGTNDTFSIFLDYRDPFSLNGDEIEKGENKVLRGEEKNFKQEGKIIQESWPSLQYSGMIRNQKTKAQLAMLTINGESRILKRGEISSNVIVSKIFNDSIEVIFNKQKRILKK